MSQEMALLKNLTVESVLLSKTKGHKAEDGITNINHFGTSAPTGTHGSHMGLNFPCKLQGNNFTTTILCKSNRVTTLYITYLIFLRLKDI